MIKFSLCLILFAGVVLAENPDLRLPLPEAIKERFPELLTEPFIDRDFTRIVGGEDEKPGQAKHQIALLRDDSFTCGGSLISPRTVLTAAHCVFGAEESPSKFKIRYNTLDRTNGPIIQVSTVNRHPSYSSKTIDNDVATLILEEAFKPGDNADVIVLAKNEPADNEELKVTGWGRLNSGGEIPVKLQKARVTKMSKSDCSTKWMLVNSITNQMLCAHNTEQSTCNGDSGGPLTNAKGELVGVVSWGPSTCIHKRLPSVFANVATLRKWIIDNTIN